MPSPPAGPTVWVGPNRAGAPYERATVGCATPSGRHYEVTTAGDGRRTVERDATVPVNTAAAASTSDHCALVHLHEATVLANTVERAAFRHFCTWVGPAQLVSVNPCAPHPDIYGDAKMAQFRGDLRRAASSAEAEPHAFAVGEAACARIARGARVAILATGESGAGKTEVNRLIVSYLVARWDVAARPGGAEGGAVREGMLRSSELLEALGNARMIANDKSSRFGKYAALVFDLAPAGTAPAGAPTLRGARVRTFLLEKNRLCRFATGERNFHALYRTLAGRPRWEGQPASYAHGEAADFHYLRDEEARRSGVSARRGGAGERTRR